MLAVLARIWRSPSLYRNQGLEVRERQGVRTLHLETDTVQSAMRVDAPYALELSYTRAMMAFLLFAPPPSKALLVGLGGGSVAKFLFRALPQTALQVVEIEAAVVEVARRFFALPEDGPRLSVHIGEGAQYVQGMRAAWDLLLVDAYDGRSLAASLATEQFFADARLALVPGGMLAMNLWSSDSAFARNLRRIERAFLGNCLCLPAERPGNVIVFAFRSPPAPMRWSDLRARAVSLQERFGLEFPRFVDALREMNRCDADRIHLGPGPVPS
jgi:spermidine synthase